MLVSSTLEHQAQKYLHSTQVLQDHKKGLLSRLLFLQSKGTILQPRSKPALLHLPIPSIQKRMHN
jgi:hypothetical protein